MRRLETRLQGPLLAEPEVHRDERGFLLESYNREAWHELGVRDDFVQDNHSRSSRGVVRGMHLQVGAGQAKLVRCVRGQVLDVIVDVRQGSPAFGSWEGFTLDDRQLRELYVPIGFAHGFCALSDVVDVAYKCSTYYDPALERGFRYDDPDVAIEWPSMELAASARDAAAPTLRELVPELPFSYGS